MKEEQLCKQVLIPLLRAMKFNDVTYYHGGAAEKGKDIVCWKESELQVRTNYALVVKSQKITGQAKSAKGTAGEVATQIQQAFGSEFIAPITGEYSKVHICWVITNKEITKQGIDAITSIIKPTNYDRYVHYIDGDKLWEYIEKYLRNYLIWGKIEDIQKTINEFDTHYQPEIFLDGNKITIGIKEKFKGASTEKPLDVKVALEFPKTSEGISKQKEFQKSIKTGSKITIPAKFIKSFEIPDSLKPIMDFDINGGELVAEPIINDHHFIASLEFINDEGDSFVLDYLDFKLQKMGTEEATLINVENGSIIKIKLILDSVRRNLKIKFNWKPQKTAYMCSQLLQIYEFNNCVSKPFTMKIISKEFGKVVFNQNFNNGISKGVSSFLVKAMKSLVALQRKNNQTIMVPVREFTVDEVEILKKIIQITNVGKINGKWSSIKMPVLNMTVDGYNALTDTVTNFKLVGNEAVQIFDIEIPLGSFDAIYHNGKISNFEEVKQMYEENCHEITMYLTPQEEEADFEKIYHNFFQREGNENTSS